MKVQSKSMELQGRTQGHTGTMTDSHCRNRVCCDWSEFSPCQCLAASTGLLMMSLSIARSERHKTKDWQLVMCSEKTEWTRPLNGSWTDERRQTLQQAQVNLKTFNISKWYIIFSLVDLFTGKVVLFFHRITRRQCWSSDMRSKSDWRKIKSGRDNEWMCQHRLC